VGGRGETWERRKEGRKSKHDFMFIWTHIYKFMCLNKPFCFVVLFYSFASIMGVCFG